MMALIMPPITLMAMQRAKARNVKAITLSITLLNQVLLNNAVSGVFWINPNSRGKSRMKSQATTAVAILQNAKRYASYIASRTVFSRVEELICNDIRPILAEVISITRPKRRGIRILNLIETSN
jgi:hypothetical protein